MQAGASMKGEFEQRLRSLIDEVQASPVPIILFIDEIHTLMGAGGAAGTGDAANLLKPALARGTLRTIGATTWMEYAKYFEKDPAMTRRFQPVNIDEPSLDRAAYMLRGILAPMEAHHGVRISDEAVVAAVNLSARYIPSRQLPDKAVSLLDTACARVAISLKTLKTEWVIPVGPTPAGIVMTPDNRYLLVAIMGEGYVEVIDWKTQKTVKKVPTDIAAHNLHPRGDGRYYFVSNRSVKGGSISLFDTQTLTVVEKYDVPGGPDDMEVRADGKELWATARFARRVQVIDLTTKMLKTSIPVGSSPRWNALPGTGSCRPIRIGASGSPWILCATRPSWKVCGKRAMRHGKCGPEPVRRPLCRAPRAGHWPYRLQGFLARVVAAPIGRISHGAGIGSRHAPFTLGTARLR